MPGLWVVPAYLIFHGLVAVLVPPRLAPFSTLCIVIAELAALWACLQTSRTAASPEGVLWLLTAFSILLHATAMSMDMLTEVMGVTKSSPIPGLQVLFSSLYSVPLLLTVSIQFDPLALRPIQIINSCLSIATGVLFCVLVFSVASVHGSDQPTAIVFIILMFDSLDFFLAVAATIRALGAEGRQERRFYCTASIFLWVNAVLPAIHNRILIKHDFVWLDLFISAPYLLLLALIFADLPRCIQNPQRSRKVIRVVRSGSPIFLSLGLLLLGISVSRIHFYIGASAILLAIIGYGAVNVYTVSGGIKTEETLLAAKRTLETLVDIDGLTGIANRRTFDRRIDLECRAASQNAQPVSLLMIDVDLFKQVNDAIGHPLGDEYLVKIAQALMSALPRSNDLVTRYGGEEFAVLLPATTSLGPAAVAKRLHRAIADLHLHHAASPSSIISISIGGSNSDDSASPSPTGLIRAADQALYRAKELGRDCTEFLAVDDDAR
jgi:diguanylate cyclase (GGDEF)-like protein